MRQIKYYFAMLLLMDLARNSRRIFYACYQHDTGGFSWISHVRTLKLFAMIFLSGILSKSATLFDNSLHILTLNLRVEDVE